MTRRTLGIVGCCGVLRQWDGGGNNKSLDVKPTANTIMLKVLDQIYTVSPLRQRRAEVRLGAVADLSF